MNGLNVKNAGKCVHIKNSYLCLHVSPYIHVGIGASLHIFLFLSSSFLFLGIKQCAKLCAYVCMCVEKFVWALDNFREKCKKDAWIWVLLTISLLFYTFNSSYFPLISALTYVWRTNILRRIKYAYHENTIHAK